MKQKLLLKAMLLLFALIAGSSSVWATDYSISWAITGVNTTASGGSDVNTALNATITPSTASGVWTAQASSSYAGSSSGAQLGSGSYTFAGTVSLSNTSIPSSATITSIGITLSSSGIAYKIDATVGGAAFGSQVSVNQKASKTYTFSGSKVGNNIVLTFSNGGNKNVIITGISVNYSVADVHVTGVSLPETAEVAINKTITLTPTFTPTNATFRNVTWDSDNTSIATVDEDGVVTGKALGSTYINVTTEDGGFTDRCLVTVNDGAINLATTGTITFNTFNGTVLGTGGYKTQDCDLTASNGNTYTWKETNGYYNNSGWQVKNGGNVQSPTIKSANGFTITVTNSNGYAVKISDGTNESTGSLTTTKTSTTVTLIGNGGYTVISGITITPTPSNPSNPVDNGNGTITITTTDNMDGWRSFYDATQDYTLDANTKAYVVRAKSGTENMVELTELDVTAIPHGEPVILKTSAADHKMVLTKTTGVATLGTNLLDKTDGTHNYDAYRLGYKSGTGIAFYKYVAKAPAAGIVYLDPEYINLSAGASALNFVIADGNTTAIKNVDAEKTTAPRKVMKDGRIVIETAEGMFSVSGARVK